MKAFPDPMRGAEQSFRNQRPESLDDGMYLRDYFAAKAMQALIQVDLTDSHIASSANGRKYSEWLADDSYRIADAMMEARECK